MKRYFFRYNNLGNSYSKGSLVHLVVYINEFMLLWMNLLFKVRYNALYNYNIVSDTGGHI